MQSSAYTPDEASSVERTAEASHDDTDTGPTTANPTPDLIDASGGSRPPMPTHTSDHVLVPAEIRATAAGRGVFATAAIDAGSTVAIFGGAAIPGPILRSLPVEDQRRALQVADDVYLLTEFDAGLGHLINHSCEPSCRMAGEVTLVAARRIEAGEELTFDYATTDSTPYDEFECECGAVICRGKVTGEDWMDPALQERYRGWFSPYLQRRIDQIRGDLARSRGPAVGHGAPWAISPPG